ncbi:MAG: hypothetical protein ABEI80_08645 [Haloplanus sp.]
MPNEALRDAAESVREAESFVEAAEKRDQLHAQAEALADLSRRDTSPDETRLRGHHYTLSELHGRVNEDARVHLKDAMERLENAAEVPF